MAETMVFTSTGGDSVSVVSTTGISTAFSAMSISGTATSGGSASFSFTAAVDASPEPPLAELEPMEEEDPAAKAALESQRAAALAGAERDRLHASALKDQADAGYARRSAAEATAAGLLAEARRQQALNDAQLMAARAAAPADPEGISGEEKPASMTLRGYRWALSVLQQTPVGLLSISPLRPRPASSRAAALHLQRCATSAAAYARPPFGAVDGGDRGDSAAHATVGHGGTHVRRSRKGIATAALESLYVPSVVQQNAAKWVAQHTGMPVPSQRAPAAGWGAQRPRPMTAPQRLARAAKLAEEIRTSGVDPAPTARREYRTRRPVLPPLDGAPFNRSLKPAPYYSPHPPSKAPPRGFTGAGVGLPGHEPVNYGARVTVPQGVPPIEVYDSRMPDGVRATGGFYPLASPLVTVKSNPAGGLTWTSARTQ